MYQIDDGDRVKEVPNVPQPDVGAPLPLVVADDLRVLLAYLVSEARSRLGRNLHDREIGIDAGRSRCVGDVPTALGSLPRHAQLPNDEAFAGHPLHERGLDPYMVAEVVNSSWLRRLERMNAVHPSHDPRGYAELRHFVFAFHDTTFECIAKGLSVEVRRGSLREVAHQMLDERVVE